MKRLIITLAVIATILGLTSCAEAKTTEFNIAYVLGNGQGDSRAIKEILMPGQDVQKETDDDVDYIYGNVRNWNVQQAQGADQTAAWTAKSKPSDDGVVPGYPLLGYGIVQFAINRPSGQESCTYDNGNLTSTSEPCRALNLFYQVCKKYGCDVDPNADTENQAQSSDQGWMNFLRENWAQALQDAYNQVVTGQPLTIVNDPSKWPALGKKMGELAWNTLSSYIGLPKDVHVFCHPDVIAGEQCHAPVVTFHSIDSPDAQKVLSSRRDQQNTTDNQLADIANRKRVQDAEQALELAKAQNNAALLAQPGYAELQARQAELDRIKACTNPVDENGKPVNTSAKCIIILGGGSTSTQLQLPTGG